ncbi:zinc finger BED domain-containing protein 5-like [Watersipora subatra]|uniref:zinc finger BED domain-containing protein 5-like n=1 Tax=Watersipora subatra TaxID=2589382 RepID=UPI00355B8DC9
MSKTKRRAYDDSYLNYGFTCMIKSGIEVPQCVLCMKVLTNDSMKPHQLKPHLRNKHAEHMDKSKAFFEAKERELKRAKLDSTGSFYIQAQAITEASYTLSYRITRDKKPHTIGETLVKPCLLKCTKIILGDTAAQKIADVFLSDSTVKSRIDDMSADIKRQRDIEEEFLFCSPLTETTTDADVMNLVSDFFSKEHLDWGKLIGVCTDGAPAMLGCHAGFAQLVKEKNPLVVEGFHQCLAYLVDILGSINEVNTKMQGRDRNVLNVTYRINAFKDKLKLWVERLATGNVRVSFPVLHSLVDKKAPSASLLTDIKHHLNSLIAEFERYFLKLDPRTEQLMSLTRDPFRRNAHEIPEQLQKFLELTNNSALKDDFKGLSIEHFWVQAST